jgi:hypothetical protein
MVEELNERILNKIGESGASNNLKKFLKDIIFFEFRYSDDPTQRHRYSEEYEKMIRVYLKKKGSE